MRGSAVVTEVFCEVSLPLEKSATCLTSATFRGVGTSYVHCELAKKKSPKNGEIVTQQWWGEVDLLIIHVELSDRVIHQNQQSARG